MTDELTLLAVNTAFLAFAYCLAFPMLGLRRLGPLMRYDAAVSLAALGVAGALYWGSGTRFGLLGFEVNWIVFGLLTYAAIEAPIFWWYCRRHGIDIASEFDAPEE